MTRTHSRFLAVAIFATIAIQPALLASNSVTPPDAEYQKSYGKWKVELVDDLKKNWLPLAGLFWLKPGDNTFGTDEKNAVVFPKGPAQAGTFTLQGTDVSAKFAAGDHATIDGKPATEAKLQPDVSGKPTVVEMGSLRFHVIVRGERVGIRVKDLDSDAVKNYQGPMFFPVDMTYRITGTFVPSDGKQTISIPNVLGDITAIPVPGTVVFKLNGREYRLTASGGNATKGISFVFGDLTSKTDTYPGGRFLETDPITNNVVVLDFNRAYSPPCAVTPYATCPLAPKENRLAVAIPAGEKYDRTHGHH